MSKFISMTIPNMNHVYFSNLTSQCTTLYPHLIPSHLQLIYSLYSFYKYLLSITYILVTVLSLGNLEVNKAYMAHLYRTYSLFLKVFILLFTAPSWPGKLYLIFSIRLKAQCFSAILPDYLPTHRELHLVHNAIQAYLALYYDNVFTRLPHQNGIQAMTISYLSLK